MAFKPKKFCELTGLQYDQSASAFWGILQGYPVFLTYIPRRNTIIFRLIAKTTSDETALQAQFTEWSQLHSGVSGLNHKDRCLSAMISLTPRKSEETLSATTAALISFAVSQALTPCCMSCGAESGFHMYMFDDGGVTVCDSCKPYVERQIREAAEVAAAVRANPIGHFTGAVIGAATVFLLTFFVLKLSYLSILTGFAGVLLGLFLMRKLGKKLTIPAIALCSMLCIIAGIGAPILHFAGTIADFNIENSAQAQQVCDAYNELNDLILMLPSDETLPEELGSMEEYKAANAQAQCILSHTDLKSCLSDMPELLKMETYSALKPELIKCLIMTLISIVGCIILTAIPMLRTDQGRHTLRELSA